MGRYLADRYLRFNFVYYHIFRLLRVSTRAHLNKLNVLLKTSMGKSQSRHEHDASKDVKPSSYLRPGLKANIPLDVVEEILLNLPAHQVVRFCRLVCHEWKELVDSAAHWEERCRREGIQPLDASRPPDDWRSFYIITKKQHNLIKNPKGEEEFNGWNIVYNGGDGWRVENNPKKIPNCTVPKRFITSYLLCSKEQLIDLRKEGYNAAFMDQLQPHIRISDWYSPRYDCGSVYQIIVELLDQKMEPINVFEPDPIFFPQWNKEPWCEMTHVFKDYGPGVRFIRFTHGGQDTKFWKGWYGIRVTNSSVEICPAEENKQMKRPGLQANIPLVVVEEILLNLPAHQVVLVCRLVCHEWKELVDSAAHWKERCRREGIQLLDASRPPDDWRSFYILTKKRRNLIKNPKGEEEFNGWNIVQNGGDGWRVQNNYSKIPNCTVPKFFATSYRLCLKEQLIDLKKEGYNAAFMDQLQPHIRISDWYSPCWDCGSVYQIIVELLDQKKKSINVFKPEPISFPQWNNEEQFCEMAHVFKDYGPGARFIRFTHGGKDRRFWAGWYGIRVTNSSVEICPAEER